MKKEFINYEQSLKLKKLGFEEPCLAFWDAYNGDSHLFLTPRTKYHWIVRIFKPVLDITTYSQGLIEYEEGDNAVLAPLHQQAFEWFREKHKLHSSIYFQKLKEGDDDDDIELYQFMINEQWVNGKDWGDYKYGFKHHSVGYNYDSHEKAKFECLKKLIEIVENKE